MLCNILFEYRTSSQNKDYLNFKANSTSEVNIRFISLRNLGGFFRRNIEIFGRIFDRHGTTSSLTDRRLFRSLHLVFVRHEKVC